MVVGINYLLSLVRDPNVRLLVGLSDRELDSPEGSGFDLRVGKIYKLNEGSEGVLNNDGLKSRKTPEATILADYNLSLKDRDQEIVVITSGNYYLVQTIEKIRLPTNLLGVIQPRTTLFRSGVSMGYSFVSPGYGLKPDDESQDGSTLTFSIVNLGPSPWNLQLGARIAHIIFLEISGETRPYSGQWQQQGGRLRTDAEDQK